MPQHLLLRVEKRDLLPMRKECGVWRVVQHCEQVHDVDKATGALCACAFSRPATAAA
jgi:hypothetical protein